MQPAPVSASNDAVYFRDGDTAVKWLGTSSGTDVTTVPGGPTTVSSFAVSPDDNRIAVVVADLSDPSTISERMYVEDLRGGGHHVDLFSTRQPIKTATAVWPMGWHQGALVLAVVPACAYYWWSVTPIEWRVVSASTAGELASIHADNCTLSLYPSPAGVACVSPAGLATRYDWTGKMVGLAQPPIAGYELTQASLSPNGSSILFAPPDYPSTYSLSEVQRLPSGPYSDYGNQSCLWIDEEHVLVGNSVMEFAPQTSSHVLVPLKVIPLRMAALCDGRLPGGL